MNKIKSLAQKAGTALVLISLLFLFYMLWKRGKEIVSLIHTPGSYIIIVAGAILYVVISILLPFAWWTALSKFENRCPTFLTCYWIYNKTQIAKYLPGNVMHFVGRQMLADKFKQSSVLIASAVEVLGLVLAALTIALLGVSFQANISIVQHHFWSLFGLAAIVLLVITSFIFLQNSTWISKRVQKYFAVTSKAFIKLFVTVCIVYLGYIIGIGVVFGCLSALLLEIKPDRMIWGTLIWGYSFSWLIGFIVPGAPGGVGIREMGLTAILSTVTSSSEALAIALFFRIITVVGDLLSFLSTYLIPEGFRIRPTQRSSTEVVGHKVD